MDPQVFEQENQKLTSTKDKLIQAKTYLEKSMDVMGAANLERLKELRDDPQSEVHDLLFFMEELHEKNTAFNFKDKYKRLEELESSLKEPYFSRIDLKEGGDVQESFYIGKFGYTEEKPIIIDWRAKIASVYYRYRYPQKNVSYDTPNGKETRDLTLKRTFEIDKGELIKYYNNDIQFDENQIIVDKIQHRTGGVLEDIVETIQESQLNIIEADPRQICVVQGCVGSGKSTVAIHKLSHIFFNFPDLIHPEKSILIAKNQILVGYLSTLFPKLGIFDINYKTLREIVYNLVFREELGLKVDFDKNTDLSSINLEHIQDIRKKVSLLHEEFEGELNTVLSIPEFNLWAGFTYNSKNTVYENLSEAIEDIEEELHLQEGYLKDSMVSIRSYRYKDNIKVLKKLTNRLRKIRVKLKESRFVEFIKSIGLNTREEMGYLDTLLYIFAYSEVIGLRNTAKYEYCVVDEGQDFSVMEYMILGKLVLRGRFCILGDLNQSYEKEGLSDWSAVSRVIPEAKHANVFELDTNYRSTKPIIDFANSILSPYTSTYLPKSINRKGNLPVTLGFSTNTDLLRKLKLDLIEDTKDLDESIGVIVYNPELMTEVENIVGSLGIDSEKIIKLDSKKRITYLPQGIYLTQFDNAKGLEFAKVYVIGLNTLKIETFNEAKKAFVALTRAMNELSVYSV